VLIAKGADIKTVQAPMRHASASTTLDTDGPRSSALRMRSATISGLVVTVTSPSGS